MSEKQKKANGTNDEKCEIFILQTTSRVRLYSVARALGPAGTTAISTLLLERVLKEITYFEAPSTYPVFEYARKLEVAHSLRLESFPGVSNKARMRLKNAPN